ncbi:MAG: LLM class flavin-dependent oxidoreductase [Pseudomonadota bacterium]
MRAGVLVGPLSDSEDPGALRALAEAVEGEGFDSLWMPQVIGRGIMVPDPFVALAVAATTTSRLELGTAIIQLPLYPPLDLAHRVFSLHQLCGDRLTLGVGAGSTITDFLAFERDHDRRFKDFNAHLSALQQVFADGTLGDIDLTPWPHLRGGPPLLYGTWGAGVERAAQAFGGWIASATYRTPDEVIETIARFRAAGGERAIVSSIQAGPDTDLGALREILGRFKRAGFDDVVMWPQPGGPGLAELRALVP